MKAGFINTGMTIDGVMQKIGYTARFDHYETWGLLWTKEIYEITTSKTHPLTFVDDVGNWWICDRHYWTDFGSIPPPLQSIPSFDRERHKFPYMFHDNSYQEKGLWWSQDSGITWAFMPMSRLVCDLFLSKMIKYDIRPSNRFDRWLIYNAVRLGGQSGYGHGDYRVQNIVPEGQIDRKKPPVAFA